MFHNDYDGHGSFTSCWQKSYTQLLFFFSSSFSLNTDFKRKFYTILYVWHIRKREWQGSNRQCRLCSCLFLYDMLAERKCACQQKRQLEIQFFLSILPTQLSVLLARSRFFVRLFHIQNLSSNDPHASLLQLSSCCLAFFCFATVY